MKGTGSETFAAAMLASLVAFGVAGALAVIVWPQVQAAIVAGLRDELRVQIPVLGKML
jgi:hypothetical protein